MKLFKVINILIQFLFNLFKSGDIIFELNHTQLIFKSDGDFYIKVKKNLIVDYELGFLSCDKDFIDNYHNVNNAIKQEDKVVNLNEFYSKKENLLKIL